MKTKKGKNVVRLAILKSHNVVYSPNLTISHGNKHVLSLQLEFIKPSLLSMK